MTECRRRQWPGPKGHKRSVVPGPFNLTAIVENDDPRADESCALAENPAGLNGFDNGEEATPVINRVGNPTVSPGNVAEMNISMPIRHGVFVARFTALADQLERLALS